MQNQFFSFQQKGILILALLLSLGFCVQAQQSVPATPPAKVIYVSQLEQMPPQKQAYIKAHSDEFTITADPVQTAVSATLTGAEDKTRVNPQDKATLKSLPQVHAPSPVGLEPAPIVTAPTKTVLTRTELDQMSAEKQAHIQAHPEQFEIKN